MVTTSHTVISKAVKMEENVLKDPLLVNTLIVRVGAGLGVGWPAEN